HAVNVQACETLAAEAERAGAWLVHYSTDYVFSGEGERPWRETDPAEPLNVYGRSKLAGEQAIARLCPRHLIFRASWLFDTWGDNFLKSILAAARRHATLQVVSDQWGAPTRAALVADATAHALRGLDARLAGTYHLSAQGETSRHGFATHLLACARRHGLTVLAGPDDVSEVPSSHYPSPARRPLNSRLDTTAAQIAFGVAFPPWQAGVDAVIAELAATAYTR
ncbi:MAG TPA: dTDP-4-dehydrorhamnose reductase, partial [Ramlibacter sp.]|nr:dTDP-4-dehydrorhamnose reductase [Ramlibacter sp.]